jgi:hypothetical protein
MTTALPTAPAAYGLKRPSATVTVDNATPQGSTYQRGYSVQTNGTTALDALNRSGRHKFEDSFLLLSIQQWLEATSNELL